ncbi:hypothetical protein BX070DRAFT_228554 [Coemansia spiralis]|nr:hypothetical protein BX070DRAFT_228554 [Coemansia spiralis]
MVARATTLSSSAIIANSFLYLHLVLFCAGITSVYDLVLKQLKYQYVESLPEYTQEPAISARVLVLLLSDISNSVIVMPAVSKKEFNAICFLVQIWLGFILGVIGI